MTVLLCLILYCVIIGLFYTVQFRLSPNCDSDEEIMIILSSVFWPTTTVVYFVYGLAKLFIFISYKIFPKKGE